MSGREVHFVDGPLKGERRVIETRYFQVYEYPELDFCTGGPDEPVNLRTKLHTYEVQGSFASLVKDA